MLHKLVIDGVIKGRLEEYSGMTIPGVFEILQLMCGVVTNGTDKQYESNPARTNGRYPHQELGVAKGRLLPTIAGILRKLTAEVKIVELSHHARTSFNRYLTSYK